MASLRDQFNTYGQQTGVPTGSNEYADLPNPQRAQQIVDEARRRLAAGGGKASMLPQMIERVTNEFASRDNMGSGNGDRAQQYVQPNNMDAYIDRVLQMSGMGQPAGANSGGGNVGSGDGDVPIPSDRPTDVDTVAMPEEPVGDEDADGEGTDPWLIAKIAAGVLGVGGAAGLARWLYNNRGAAADAASQAADGLDGTINSTLGDDESKMGGGGGNALTPENGPIDSTNTGPRVTATDVVPNAVDDTINATMGDDPAAAAASRMAPDIDEAAAAASAEPGQKFADQADIIKRATDMVRSGDIRGGVNLMRENGIDINDEMLRTLAERSNTVKNMKKRAGAAAGNTARKAASKSAGKAARDAAR